MFFCTSSTAEVKYADGVYEGADGFIQVRVEIKKGDISNIEIVKHGGGGKEYEDMVRPLLKEMIRKQSTDVDVVTGATTSSKYLKKAVSNALTKAAR